MADQPLHQNIDPGTAPLRERGDLDTEIPLQWPAGFRTVPVGHGPDRDEFDETADPAESIPRVSPYRRYAFDTGHSHPGHYHPNSSLHIDSDDDLLD